MYYKPSDGWAHNPDADIALQAGTDRGTATRSTCRGFVDKNWTIVTPVKETRYYSNPLRAQYDSADPTTRSLEEHILLTGEISVADSINAQDMGFIHISIYAIMSCVDAVSYWLISPLIVNDSVCIT